MAENNKKAKHTFGWSIGGKPITGGSDARKSHRRKNQELEKKYSGANRYFDKPVKGPAWDKPKKLEYEAGSGSIPSGTNTHIDKAKWGRRADGSSGPL
jgi:hypothetical protein